MILYKKFPFSFEKKDYEIKVLNDEKTINIVAFHNNYPVNGLRHQIQVPKYVNIKKLLKSDIINDLVQMAKNDIIEKRWEKLIR